MKVPQVPRPQDPFAATLTAAPPGLLEAGVRDATGKMPLVTKANDNDVLRDEEDPIQALIASVQDALHLGCSPVGFTFHSGSAHQLKMHGQLRASAEDAKRRLAVVVWPEPRGSAVGVVGCGVQISTHLGAHVINAKQQTAHVEQEADPKVCDEQRILIATSAERVRHVIDGAFAVCRIVIFSGGAAALDDDKWLDDVRAIYAGEELGPIIGCHPVQRPKDEAIRMLAAVMDIYAGAPDRTRTC